MKKLPLILGIAIIVFFGGIISVMLAWNPIYYKYMAGKASSKTAETRDEAVNTLAKRGMEAVNYMRRWLKSKNDLLVDSASRVLIRMDDKSWDKALPEIENILDDRNASLEKSDSVCRLLIAKIFPWEEKYSFKTHRIEKFYCYFMRNSEEPVAQKSFPMKHQYGSYMTMYQRNGTLFPAEKVRFHSIKKLGEIRGIKSIKAVGEALKKDSSEEVRLQAALVLKDIGDERVSGPVSFALMRDSSPFVRRTAAELLGNARIKKAAPPLEKTLKEDSSPIVRAMAAESLGLIGDKSSEKHIIAAMHEDKDPTVRAAAAKALGELGLDSSMPSLIKTLSEEKSWPARENAVKAAGMIGGRDALPVIVKVLDKDSHKYVKRAAVEALGMLKNPDAVGPLADALENSPESAVRIAAAFSLGKIATDEAVDALSGKYIKNAPYGLRLAAAEALSLTGNPGAIGILFEWLEREADSGGAVSEIREYLSRLPDECPLKKAGSADLKERIEESRTWLKRVSGRLSWDVEKKKYFLQSR